MQDSLEDVQPQLQSEVSGSATVFEKKWISTEVGDDNGTSSSLCIAAVLAYAPPIHQAVSLATHMQPHPRPYSSKDATVSFQDDLEKNGIFFDPNLDSGSEISEGMYRRAPLCT
jgi:hypothetical protein